MIWDIKLVPKRRHIPVKYIHNYGEVGQDTRLIPVYNDADREWIKNLKLDEVPF